MNSEKDSRDKKDRIIPETLEKSHIIIRSAGNKRLSDIESIIAKWNILHK